MNHSSKQSKAANLRQKAETLLRINSSENGSPLSEIETLKLIHELHVHQIELELINEELMLASSAAQDAAEKYTELYDFAPSDYFTLSKEGKIIELNLSGAKMLGKERSRIKNRQFDFFVSDDTKPIFNLFLENVFNSKATESCEVILSVNDNSAMDVQLTGIATKNGEQCLVTVIEITERKRAEQELIIANKELTFHNKEKEKRAAALVIANKELTFQNEEKEKRAAELIIANKELAFQNKEKEKRAEELARSKQLLDEAGRLARIGGWEIDLKNNKLSWSDVVYQIHEIEPDYQPTVESGINFYAPESIPVIYEAVSQAIEEGKSFDLDLQMITAKQNRIWVRAIGQAYRVNGEIVKIGGVFQDINERKQVEEELVIANKELAIQIEEKEKRAEELIEAKKHAEESDRLKSAFLANMSHEIRTPMNGILGFAELLKEPDLAGEQQQEYIRIIEKSGARMLNIINDIVDISKIESGQMKVNTKELNINEKIEYIHTFFKPETENKGIEFNFKNGLSANEAIIKADQEKIYAILTNLVKNAIKYCDKGSIEFGYDLVETHGRASLTDPASLQHASYMQFYVKDTGIGIPKSRQQAIFDRFIQADIADKMARQGAGLGLTISKAYVEMLGGKIWVESEVGKGSTFYFTLPYHAEHEEETDSKNIISVEEANTLIKKLNILIVEDDEVSEKLLEMEIKKFNKKVFKAKTGFEAVEVCRNNPDLDLVLMDIKMPEMDGYEATRQIRQFNKDVVIIAQTAYALTGDREDALAAGCNDYVSKPIRKDKLIEVMQRYFQ